MSVKVDFKEIVAYDFSNLNLQENSISNCFGCDSCDCNCDCDAGDCDCDSACDNNW